MTKLFGTGPVVIVDDDPDAVMLTEYVVDESEIVNPVLSFSTGKQLLQYMDNVKQGRAVMPSVIFLDVNMPAPNGHETLQLIRTQPEFEALPVIIILTASNDSSDIQKAMKAGANGYQVKSFGLNEFIGFVNSLAPVM